MATHTENGMPILTDSTCHTIFKDLARRSFSELKAMMDDETEDHEQDECKNPFCVCRLMDEQRELADLIIRFAAIVDAAARFSPTLATQKAVEGMMTVYVAMERQELVYKSENVSA